MSVADKIMKLKDGKILYDDLRGRINDVGDKKSDVIISSASGAIVSFTDGADGLPVKDMLIEVNPVQDLHGQDEPYPPGLGKNKLHNTRTSGENEGVTFTTYEDGSMQLNGTVSSSYGLNINSEFTLPAGTYILSGCPSGGSSETYYLYLQIGSKNYRDYGEGVSFEVTQGQTCLVRLYLIANAVFNNTMFYPMIRLASVSDATFAPYSNICPITGWTEANAWRTGKNLLPTTSNSRTYNGITYTVNADGSIKISGTATATSWLNGGATRSRIKAGTYTISGGISDIALYIVGYNVDGTQVNNTTIGGSDTGNGRTFTLTQDADIYWQTAISSGKTVDTTIYPMLAVGTSVVPWQPYSGISVNIPFGQTVYGGNVNPVTGVMIIDRALFEFDGSSDEGWRKSSTYGYFASGNISGVIDANASSSNFKSDIYKYGNIANGTSTLGACLIWAQIRVRLADMSISESDFTASLANTPMHALLRLATPITIQLDPVTLNTLLGQNHIWADSGNISVDYPVDTKLYINDNIKVTDVQINETSIVTNGVANIPLASTSTAGVVKFNNTYGAHTSNGTFILDRATDLAIKSGNHQYQPIVPYNQHVAAFYGLAKAAGDSTQSASDNAVGTYTSEAKTAIRTMLDVASTSDVSVKYTKPQTGIPASDLASGVIPSVPVQDVQINSTSIVDANGDANIPIASSSNLGLVRVNTDYGIFINSVTGDIVIRTAGSNHIKEGTNIYFPIVPSYQHNSTFYGLAKAAGDTTQALSNNAVGTYTNEAKTAIRTMLDVASTNDVAAKYTKPNSGIPASDLATGVIPDISGKADKTDTVLETTLSRGRKANTTIGTRSFAFGNSVTASGTDAYAEGNQTTASGNFSHAEGDRTTASGEGSHSAGGQTIASGWCAFAEGYMTQSTGYVTHSEGYNTIASGAYSHTQGQGTTAKNYAQHVIGTFNIEDPSTNGPTLKGEYVEIVGNGTTDGSSTTRSNARALGWNGNEYLAGDLYVNCNSDSTGGSRVATIDDTLIAVQDATPTDPDVKIWLPATAPSSVQVPTYAEHQALASLVAQKYTKPSGGIPASDIASGVIPDISTKADKADTVLTTTLSRGRKANTTVGTGSLAFGVDVEASANSAVAIGTEAKASGATAVSIGYQTQATGYASYAEGYQTQSTNYFSHAEGSNTVASGGCSHASGYGTVANHNTQFVFGQYNIADTSTATGVENGNYIEIVGNGANNSNRSNARALDWSGNEYLAGNVYVNCGSDLSNGTMLPTDVQIDGTSIVSNGIAEIPVASWEDYGVSKMATNDAVKEGIEYQSFISPFRNHLSVFYGLAKAAGDTTQALSENVVGTYTAEAKTAIRTMLGVDQSVALVETVTGTTPTITAMPNVRYICGEATTITITPPANGTCDVVFDSGTTATVLTVPNTVRFPAWFDATALEANTTYEIMITDGTYGSVMTWAS